MDCGDRECDNDECISNVPTEAPLNFVCPESNGYFPDESDCAQFIVCENDAATQKICPVGDDGAQWLYKAESEWCDYPENVDCQERPICDDDGNCVTDEPDFCLSAGIDCSDGDGYHEEEPCGQCACYCSGGNLTGDEVCCDGDLVWNPALNVCDWDYNVPACS